jgi:hypothetical protein
VPQGDDTLTVSIAASSPIPLKYFGSVNLTGQAKKIVLSKGDDVFIAGEGEIVDRRYKVVRISATSVEIQDLVVGGLPQSIPLTEGNPREEVGRANARIGAELAELTATAP